jgi:23S rRNA pseudouridine2605 synthase
MITENEDWRPRNRYSEDGQDDEAQKAKRPYQPYNNNRGNYNRPYDNDRPRPAYNRPQNGFTRPAAFSGGNNYDRPNGYENREGGYQQRPRQYNNNYQQRPQQGGYRQYDNNRGYDNRPEGQDDNNPMQKRRRPRMGEASAQPQRPQGYNQNRQQGGYNNNRYDNYQGGGYQQRGGYNNQGGYQQRPQGNRPYQQGGPQQKNRPQQQQQPFNNKKLKYREENFDPNEEFRLNKFLSNAGVCSRREADEFIKAGVVQVNGVTVSELGVKVKRSDAITFHNEPVTLEQKVYVLLNKPRNCVTTADDPQERLTVMDMVKTACTERIFPVGRLDRNTTGVLLLTNDGDLSSKLTHPKYLKKKIYHVWLDKPVAIEDMQKMADGIELEDGEIHADAISYVTDEDKDQVGVEIHSGRNRIVRRMFESLGYHVTKLDRVYFAGLTKKNLKRGQWRYLNEKEVALLRMGAFD